MYCSPISEEISHVPHLRCHVQLELGSARGKGPRARQRATRRRGREYSETSQGALCLRLRRNKLDIQRQALSVEAGGLNHLDARREERQALVVRIKDLGTREKMVRRNSSPPAES